ncbi:MAG: hypothetical protein DMF81_04045, partial [Acidobacteria bacterium]
EFASPLAIDSAEARFDQMDRNGNGVLTRGEWVGQALSFDDVDRNRDGRISLDEYMNARASGYYSGTGSLETRFARLDRNGDGVLSRGEWRGEPMSFRQADRNGDGVVTLNEYLNASVVNEVPLGSSYGNEYGYGANPRAERFRQADRYGRGYVTRSEWPYDQVQFDELDRNHDGRLSLSEYMNTQTLSDRFRRLDYNGDGVLSRREWNGTAQDFAMYDRNGDGVVSLDEYLNH